MNFENFRENFEQCTEWFKFKKPSSKITEQEEYLASFEKKNNINVVLYYKNQIKRKGTQNTKNELSICFKNKKEFELKPNQMFSNIGFTKFGNDQRLRTDTREILFTHRNQFYNCTKDKMLNQDIDKTQYFTIEMKAVHGKTLSDDEFIKICKKRVTENAEVCKALDIPHHDTKLYEVFVVKSFLHHHLGNGINYKHVSYDEAKIYSECEMGALIWCSKNTQFKNCRSFDINSAYPYIYTKSDFMLPIREGKIGIVKDWDKTGLYRLSQKQQYPTENNYFRQNPENYYTNWDLINLKELGFKIILADDGENNSLTYEKDDCIPISSLFSKVANKLYDLKQTQGNKFVGSVLKTFWGYLSQKNVRWVEKSNETEEQIKQLTKDDLILKIIKRDGKIIYGYTVKEKPYKTPLARIKPFITAYQRLTLSRLVRQVENTLNKTVYRVHTDSILTDATEEEMNKICDISNELGDLKVEKEFVGLHEIVSQFTILKLDDKSEIVEEKDFDDFDFE